MVIISRVLGKNYVGKMNKNINIVGSLTELTLGPYLAKLFKRNVRI